MTRLPLILALALAAASAHAFNWSWSWQMPRSRYSALDFTLRASVDRAAQTTEQAESARRNGKPQPDLIPLYRGAAAEWRKIQIQGESDDYDEALLAYVVFMQGYCKMLAGDRNEALKLFAELTDIYEDQDWITIPGRYFGGKCKIDMGDLRAGSAELDELLADEKAAGHPVLAFALLDRARRQWNEGKFEAAEKLYFRILTDEFYEGARRPFKDAQQELYNCLTADLKIDQLDRVVTAGLAPDDEQGRAKAYAGFLEHYLDWFPHWHGGPNAALAQVDAKNKDHSAYAQKVRRAVLAWAKKKPGPADQLLTLEIYVLCAEKSYDAARAVAARIKDLELQSLRRYGIENSAKNWPAALLALDEYIARKPSESNVAWAKYEKASIYRNAQKDLDKAIAIYRDFGNAVRAQWELARTYREKGDMKKARATLNEIAATNPREAPAAVWEDAQWYERDGDTKRAIALYRRLLSQPEWKKSVQSSWAHQALERFGINTGGAMINEVR